jgi:hypothetical protein
MKVLTSCEKLCPIQVPGTGTGTGTLHSCSPTGGTLRVLYSVPYPVLVVLVSSSARFIHRGGGGWIYW